MPFELFIMLVMLTLVVGFILGSCYIGRTIKILAHKIVECMDEKIEFDSKKYEDINKAVAGLLDDWNGSSEQKQSNN